MRLTYERFEVPICEKLKNNIFHLWSTFFDRTDEDFREIYSGQESAYNREILYLARDGDQVVGTCHLTISRSIPSLGGVGGVAVAPAYQGRGIATDLCEMARDEFRSEGGRAIFLGTTNPVAERIYRRLGWQNIQNSSAMVFIANAMSPEQYLADFLGATGPVTIARGTPAIRLPLIPLILTPHPWRVMDANAEILSRRYTPQRSCMGLYCNYEPLISSTFAAVNAAGKVFGLATGKLASPGLCQVDGFTHDNVPELMPSLIKSVADWASATEAETLLAKLAPEDKAKHQLFKSLGFSETGLSEKTAVKAKEFALLHFERPVS